MTLLLRSLMNIAAASSLRTSMHYQPPAWALRALTPPAHGRLLLASLPTPLHHVPLHGPLLSLFRDLGIDFYIKRDDSSGGVELGGNKIRKLEFLLADALARGCDSVVTIGGEQSNHCRATAAAARMVGLEPHLILRSGSADESDLGFVGNLLIDRILGSSIYTCTPGEYGRVGSDQLVSRVCEYLERVSGKRPYPIPVGGSNAVGSWGYIQGVDELLHQWKELVRGTDNAFLDHIVFACGSGGTATGIALGIVLAFAGSGDNQLTGPQPQVHAVGVCDDPDYFYSYIASIADAMGFKIASLPTSQACTTTEAFLRKHLTLHQGKGLGYAQSSPEELEFMLNFARETGIVVDPVYSGKALYNFYKLVEKQPESFRGQKILFWHTGGVLGMYDKCNELRDTAVRFSPCQRLDVYGRGQGIDISTL